MNKVMESVLEASGITLQDILSRSRKWDFVKPRIIYARMRKSQGASEKEIGKEVNRTRSTVWHYLQQYEIDIVYDKKLKQLNEKVKAIYEKCN